MKTSYSRAWEYEPLTYVSLIFRITYNMEIILHRNTSYFISWEPNILSKAEAPLQQVLLNMRVWGNGEEGMQE